jgi:hypothetical protein
MTLDANGNLLVGTNTAQFGAANRGAIEANGSVGAILGLSVGGVAKAHMYNEGTNTFINNWNPAGTVQLQINNITRLTINATQLVDAANFVELGWRDLPQNTQAASYTLTQNDRGRMVAMGTLANSTLTVPALPINAQTEVYTVMYVAGGAGTFLNIVAGSGVTFYWGAGSPNSGTTRKLGYCGVATIIRLGGANSYFITGTGLS